MRETTITQQGVKESATQKKNSKKKQVLKMKFDFLSIKPSLRQMSCMYLPACLPCPLGSCPACPLGSCPPLSYPPLPRFPCTRRLSERSRAVVIQYCQTWRRIYNPSGFLVSLLPGVTALLGMDASSSLSE